MVKIIETGVAEVPGGEGKILTVRGFIQNNEALEADDIAALLDVLEQAASTLKAQGKSSAPSEAPTGGRRSRGSASASAAEEPSETVSAPATGRRRAAAATEEPAEEPAPRRRRVAEEPAEEPAPRRRRVVEEPTAEPAPRRRAAAADAGISDLDLAKAASAAGEVLTPKLVLQILKEDHGCTEVNKLPQSERKKFLATLDKEVELANADN